MGAERALEKIQRQMRVTERDKHTGFEEGQKTLKATGEKL